MERTAQVFSSFEEADRAEIDTYARLAPSERVDILLDLIEQYRSTFGQAAERFERVYRIAELSQG